MTDFVDTLRRAQSGDEDALRELIVRFQADVRGICFDVQLEGADLSVSDLQQEVWLRVWCKIDQFTGTADEPVCLLMFRRWLRATSRNVLLNIVAARQAKCRRPAKTPTSLDQPVRGRSDPLDSTTPSRLVAAEEDAARVRGAIAAIDCPQSRRIIELRFLENRTLQEIAEELGFTYDQVRDRHKIAIQVLEKRLNQPHSKKVHHDKD